MSTMTPTDRPPTRPSNTFSLVSLVAGLCGLTVLPGAASAVAVVTGHLARRQIALTGEDGGSWATVGLVTGYIGLAILALVVLAIGLSLLIMAGAFAVALATGDLAAG